MSRSKKIKKNIKLKTALYNHIINNKREYLIVTILFFIGIVISIFFINSTTDKQVEEVNTYLNTLFSYIKEYKSIDLFSLLKQSLFSNTIILIVLWFGASTIIGIPVVYGTIIFKGFSIGYTISSIMIFLGPLKGTVIAMVLLLLHNIIFIPAMFATSVSRCKSI